MDLSNISTAIEAELWVKPLTKEKIGKSKDIGKLSLASNFKSLNLLINKKVINLKLRDEIQWNNIFSHLNRNCANLVELQQTDANGYALLRVMFFNGEEINLGDIDISVDKKIRKKAKGQGFRHNNTEHFIKKLHNNCILQTNILSDNEQYALIFMGGAAESELSDIAEENSQTKVIDDGFLINGEYANLVINTISLNPAESTGKKFLNVKKIIKNSRLQKEGALRLARVNLKFKNENEVDILQSLAAHEIKKITEQDNSYLKKWDEYGEEEGEILLEKVRKVGVLNIVSAEKNKGVKVLLELPLGKDVLTDSDELNFVSEDEVPPYLLNMEMSWKEYSDILFSEYQQKNGQSIKSKKVKKKKKNTSIKILDISSHSLELAIGSIPEKRKLILSIDGDWIQVERRMAARAMIKEGRSANPLLGLLIEEQGNIPAIQKKSDIKPLTPFVKEKVFPTNDPTPKQVEAIKIALNTPDIAIIQGPPGTGKTTVVTAILERLNEEHDKTTNINGTVLISGFQHDAVENIISRLSINALPAIKFGDKSGKNDFSLSNTDMKIDKWCQGVAKKVREQSPQLKTSEEILQINKLFVLYQRSPSAQSALNLLHLCNKNKSISINEALKTRLEFLIENIKEQMQPKQETELRCIRALRVTQAGFSDDGQVRANHFLDMFEDILTSTEISLLYKAISYREGGEIGFLKGLIKLRNDYLERFTPRVEFTIPKPRQDVLSLVGRGITEIEQQEKHEDKTNVVLANYLHELEFNPSGIKESIENYNFVYAATTQQSEGTAIKKAKGKKCFITYDTVIIDEAARASPRDLMIPMAQATKRIILVGDHRQLPHIVDESIVTKLREQEGNDQIDKTENDYINTSMFQYLFKRLQKLELVDKQPRTVTLDAQYRTHPLLGQFASDNFYKQYNEEYRSPTETEIPLKEFKHNLKGIKDTPALWLHVPHSKVEKSATKSSYRRLEAQEIAKQIDSWIKSEQGNKLTFGVISFYKAQVNEVFKALGKYDITESIDGQWLIKETYRYLIKSNGETEERLRIGTVDSFQGMEFDVVFLSIVRSNNMEKESRKLVKSKLLAKVQQQTFGHLMSKNRLCVSMTRQKKLLVVTGNKDLIQHEISTEAVPELQNYYHLCVEQGGVYNGK